MLMKEGIGIKEGRIGGRGREGGRNERMKGKGSEGGREGRRGKKEGKQ